LRENVIFRTPGDSVPKLIKPPYRIGSDYKLTVAEKERPGNTIPDTFDYEGRLLDTATLIDELCMHFEKQIAQSGGAK